MTETMASSALRTEAARRARQVLTFLLVSAGIWAACFAWRPPGPMLGLRHEEHLPPGTAQVALTIDDAPHPLTTPLLLAALKRAGIKATFFCVGDGLRMYPELAARIVQEGHSMGNHSQYHRNLTRVSPAEYSHEVETCFDTIRATRGAAGVQAGAETRLFRPPGGGLNRPVMQFLYDHDATLAWWSNNVGDWALLPAWQIAFHIKATMRPGDIFLLHDAGTGTPQAIPAIVREATDRGLHFVTMPER